MISKPIRSDDENALEKLQEKAKLLKEEQEEMKKANTYYRKNGSMKGYEGMRDEQAARIDEKIKNGYSWERQPHPAWKLQNNNQNLRATEQRIKSLQQEESRTEEDIQYDTAKYGFEVVENKEAMRLQLIFDGKPKESTRNQLKSNGFKWSPTNNCWQRLLNNNARYSLKRLISLMDCDTKTKSQMEM